MSQSEAFFDEEFHVTAGLIGQERFFFSVLKMGRASKKKQHPVYWPPGPSFFYLILSTRSIWID